MATLPGSDFYCRILLVSRFSLWSGAFVFTGFYLRYLNSGAVKYLWLSALCICFHYSLLALCVAAVLNLLLRYRFKVYYLILIVSFIVRFAKIALSLISHNLAYLKTTSKRALGIKISYSLLESMQRKYASMVISSICFVKQLPFSVSWLWSIYYIKNRERILGAECQILGFCILLLSFANFGYVSLTFMIDSSNLPCYSYMFLHICGLWIFNPNWVLSPSY